MPYNNEKIIGLDMDGVIIDFSQLRISLAKDFGFKLGPGQTPSDILKNLIPAEIFRELQKLIYDDPKIALSPPLMPGAKNVLYNMKKKRINYSLISRRRDSEIAIKLLKKHRLWPVIFNEKNTAFVDSIEGKNIKAIEFGVTDYLDDEVKVLKSLSDVTNKFLFDQFSVRMNADFYTRINSWDEASSRILL